MKVSHLGVTDFEPVWHEMKKFSRLRMPDTEDEIWFVEHSPVYTQGTSCHDVPFHNPQNIPVIHTDRGGKMTYHGPGQLIAYLLMDIKRLGSGPRSFVKGMEYTVIQLLEQYGIHGERREGAPGIYVDHGKIAALGLRITRGCCYHGLSINVKMDLSPYQEIIPCGLADIKITQIADYIPEIRMDTVSKALEQELMSQFSC